MKKTIYIFLVIALSCSTSKSLTSLSFKGYDNSSKKKYSYKLYPPQKFSLKIIQGGSEWEEKQCIYPDKSILYINNESGTPTINYHNIERNNVNLEKSFLVHIEKDTLTLSGIDDQGKYWKNKKYKKINIGYLNVPSDKVKEFDKALLSLE